MGIGSGAWRRSCGGFRASTTGAGPATAPSSSQWPHPESGLGVWGPAWPPLPGITPLASTRTEDPGPLENSSPCLPRAQLLLAEVSRERGELQGERGELRGRLARLELERAQLEMQSQQLRESNQQLDLSACRLTTQCEVWLGGRRGCGCVWGSRKPIPRWS